MVLSYWDESRQCRLLAEWLQTMLQAEMQAQKEILCMLLYIFNVKCNWKWDVLEFDILFIQETFLFLFLVSVNILNHLVIV